MGKGFLKKTTLFVYLFNFVNLELSKHITICSYWTHFLILRKREFSFFFKDVSHSDYLHFVQFPHIKFWSFMTHLYYIRSIRTSYVFLHASMCADVCLGFCLGFGSLRVFGFAQLMHLLWIKMNFIKLTLLLCSSYAYGSLWLFMSNPCMSTYV